MPDPSELANLLGDWLPGATFPGPGTTLRCGVSGGADSLALLALGVAAGCDVTAVHVDHGQRRAGPAEAEIVALRAASIGAGFEGHSVEIAGGPNLEARMRAARYSVLGADAATGHTADDQAETVLINLLRGSGVVGLGAMEPGHRRPILRLRRGDTEAVCARLRWEPVSDPTNADPAFVRNRIRHELIPLMSAIADRDVVPILVRTARHARSAAQALSDLAAELDPADALALDRARPAVAAIALQRWIAAGTGAEHPIDAASVERILAVATGDAVATEVTGGHRVSRSGQRLRIEAGTPEL